MHDRHVHRRGRERYDRLDCGKCILTAIKEILSMPRCMPDHLHLIVTPGDSTTLEKSMQLIKGGSSREIGKRDGMRFPVWHAGFAEHQIRDQRDFDSHAKYIDENPVKARLAEKAPDYPWGSAAGKFALDPWPVASGAEAPSLTSGVTAGLKPRPSVAASEDGVGQTSRSETPISTGADKESPGPRPSNPRAKVAH